MLPGPAAGRRYDRVLVRAFGADSLRPVLTAIVDVSFTGRTAGRVDEVAFVPPLGSTLEPGDRVVVNVRHRLLGSLEWRLDGTTAGGRTVGEGWFVPPGLPRGSIKHALPTLTDGERFVELTVEARSPGEEDVAVLQRFEMDHSFAAPTAAAIDGLQVVPPSPATLPASEPVTVRFRYTSSVSARWVVQGWDDESIGRHIGNFVLPPTDVPTEITRTLPGLRPGVATLSSTFGPGPRAASST